VEPKAWKDVVAALLFLLAGFTDFLDGYLARRMDMVTRLGQFLDPLADKIYISVVLIMLFLIGRIGWWVPAVIIGRELIITAFRIYAGFRGVSVPATMLAKLKTNYQVIAIVLVILHFPVDQHYLHEIIAVWLAVAMTIVSGLDYMINVRKFMMAKG
jgi:CDP-diacylglycerol--glycerol-3-phosphate 3-phosphatidyltransferase